MAILRIQRSLVSFTVALNLFNFATGMVGVFVPLIMLQHGAQLWQVPMFYVVYAGTKICLNYWVIRLIQTRGPHFGLGLGFAAGGIQFVLLWLFTSSGAYFTLWGAAAALALVNASIWSSQHLHISEVVTGGTQASSLATMEVVNQINGVVAPLLGGLLALWLGAGPLLVVAALFVLAAFIPLHYVGRHHDMDPTVSRIKYRLSHAPKGDTFGNFCFSIETAVGTMLWPLYLAIEIKTYESIGLIAAASALVAMVVVVVAGHRGDKGHDRRVLTEGIAASSILDFLRLIPFNFVGIALISVGYRGSLSYMLNPWMSTYYYHSKQGGVAYIMSMESACDLAYISLWLIILALALFWTTNAMFNFAFVSAAVAAWGCLTMTRSSRSEHSHTSLSQPAEAS